MALTYSATESTGAVVLWDGPEAIADLTDCAGDFDTKVKRAKEIALAVNELRAPGPYLYGEVSV